LLCSNLVDTGFVHNGKKGHVEIVFQPPAGDARRPSPVSWKLPLWRKRSAGKTDWEHSSSQSKLELFQEIILPHLDAAHNLARWLTRNEIDAQDVVQESYLRAFKFFDGYKGGDGKAWLLTIVRNTWRTWQRRENRESAAVPFDEGTHSGEGGAPNQEQDLVQGEKMGILRTCIEMLPVDFREVLIMRELEEMSYQEIADVTGLAIGTVMSRLSRARKRLEECAANRTMEVAG
jgi:RNA polymerase sigma-70 factor (ECF subfamily)